MTENKYNIILDRSPTSFRGIPINTDFRIGIQIYQTFYDSNISDKERYVRLVQLLFGVEYTKDGIPLFGVIDSDEYKYLEHRCVLEVGSELYVDAIQWYLSFGSVGAIEHENEDDNTKHEYDSEEDATNVITRAYDFDIDSYSIYASFMRVYHIDLSVVDMHWFKFGALLMELVYVKTEDTFGDIVRYRTISTRGMSKEEKAFYKNKKATYSLDSQVRHSREDISVLHRAMPKEDFELATGLRYNDYDDEGNRI